MCAFGTICLRANCSIHYSTMGRKRRSEQDDPIEVLNRRARHNQRREGRNEYIVPSRGCVLGAVLGRLCARLCGCLCVSLRLLFLYRVYVLLT